MFQPATSQISIKTTSFCGLFKKLDSWFACDDNQISVEGKGFFSSSWCIERRVNHSRCIRAHFGTCVSTSNCTSFLHAHTAVVLSAGMMLLLAAEQELLKRWAYFLGTEVAAEAVISAQVPYCKHCNETIYTRDTSISLKSQEVLWGLGDSVL